MAFSIVYIYDHLYLPLVTKYSNADNTKPHAKVIQSGGVSGVLDQHTSELNTINPE
jgi:hypothetical protein